MKVKLLSTEITSYPKYLVGVKDKRFKTGYRIPPRAYVLQDITLTVENPDNYLSPHCVVQNEIGQFVVTGIDKVNKTAQLRVAGMLERTNIRFEEWIDVPVRYRAFSEGSTYVTPPKP